MVLRQTFKNHFIRLEFTITVTLLFLAGWWYFNKDFEALIFVAGLYTLLFTIPSLYLHIQYGFRNAGEEIEISYNEIIVRKHGQESRYSSSELAKIIVYKSASLDKGGIQLTAVEGYYYCRIITKNKVEIIITCLLGPKIEEEARKLIGVPFERKKRFFCSLNWK